ncbi:hypothetical protein [Streptomyces sp. NPDC089919]|uniref:hypothetical protein n=1 Tax=Streptomyces sp. NPDC089919 TaxID=3155188 RepID=UPI003433398E
MTRPPAPETTPAAAYAMAPSIISEIGWTADRAVRALRGQEADREFWLRKAALLDRIALDDERAHIHGDATEAAQRAAQRLMDIDQVEALTEPRAYVRQQYAHWARHQ